jgi:hypothetical protein
MKAMMDRPHSIRFEDKIVDDSDLEPIRGPYRANAHDHLIPLLAFLCVILAVIWFVRS